MTSEDLRKLESIADDILASFPVLFRRVSKEKGHPSAKRLDQSLPVLGVLLNHGPIPMSEIGRKMGISKPYTTVLIDRLIKKGLVERVLDADDRRLVNIRITTAGRDSFKEFRKFAREIVIRNLSSLTSDDISSFYSSMKTIRSITSKLDKDKTKKCERG
jgi:DNA-binding MarR family transcriptional regulator